MAERRRLVASHLAYPLASLGLLIVLAIGLRLLAPPGPWYGSLVSLWWAAPSALLALVLTVAPWKPRWHLPGSAWARHLDLASRWSRAALAVRWRLTEAQSLHLLGTDLAPLSAVLGSPGAEAHCRMLAGWHQRTAVRRLVWTARITAALILITGGGVVLASVRLWTGAGN